MSAVAWIALGVAVWFVIATVTALLVCPRLAQASGQCPAPTESEEP